MGKHRDLYRRWRQAKQRLQEVFQTADHTVVVHYSCESFYERENPRSPRITSIAVRNLDTGQTKSFSIHLVAERRALLDRIEQHYDELEKDMLEDFFQNARTLQHCKWLHWNMRDANYGFEALENRSRTLGGDPFKIEERNRYDLSRILISIYGVGYIAHPRLETLMERNKIRTRDFLTGQQEADAFVRKEFVKLHQSTLRKVDVLANIAERAHSDTLRSNATWWEKNGLSVRAAGEWIKEHWLIGALITIGGLVAVAIRIWSVI